MEEDRKFNSLSYQVRNNMEITKIDWRNDSYEI